MKYFLEISQQGQDSKGDQLYSLTEKNWYDWNKPGRWSDVGLKVGKKIEIWQELKSYLRFKKPEYIFGKQHIIEYIRQEKLKELGIWKNIQN